MADRRSISARQRDLALRILPFIRPIPSPFAAFIPLQGSAMHFKATQQCNHYTALCTIIGHFTIYSELIEIFAFGCNIFCEKICFFCIFLTNHKVLQVCISGGRLKEMLAAGGHLGSSERAPKGSYFWVSGDQITLPLDSAYPKFQLSQRIQCGSCLLF